MTTNTSSQQHSTGSCLAAIPQPQPHATATPPAPHPTHPKSNHPSEHTPASPLCPCRLTHQSCLYFCMVCCRHSSLRADCRRRSACAHGHAMNGRSPRHKQQTSKQAGESCGLSDDPKTNNSVNIQQLCHQAYVHQRTSCSC
jgi:hypothetical protein